MVSRTSPLKPISVFLQISPLFSFFSSPRPAAPGLCSGSLPVLQVSLLLSPLLCPGGTRLRTEARPEPRGSPGALPGADRKRRQQPRRRQNLPGLLSPNLHRRPRPGRRQQRAPPRGRGVAALLRSADRALPSPSPPRPQRCPAGTADPAEPPPHPGFPSGGAVSRGGLGAVRGNPGGAVSRRDKRHPREGEAAPRRAPHRQ